MAAYRKLKSGKSGLPAACVLLLLSVSALVGCKSPEERAQAYYESGIKLLHEGQPAKASLEFRNALKAKDDFIPALYSLGLTEEQQGRFDSAAKIYMTVAERAPQDVDSRIRLASILVMAGQLDDALTYADQANALAPSKPEILALKGAIALKRDNRGDAVRFADAALAIDPKNVDALIVRAAERLTASDPKGALSFIDRSGEGAQSNIGLQLLKINVLSALNDQQGVEDVFKALIKAYPNEAVFRDGLVRWYVGRDRKADAEKILRQAATDNPDNLQAELTLVSFLRAEQGVDAAKAELNSRIEKGGKVSPFKSALAQLAFESGDYAGAVDQMQKLIAETGQSSADTTAAKLQLARMMIAKNHNDDADKLVNAVLADDKDNVDALTMRAAIRMGSGHIADAIEDLRGAINEAPQSGQIMQMLAEAYERNGDITLAEEEYAKAAERNPEIGISYAQFMLRYGKLEQADKILTGLTAAAPRNGQVMALLAQVKLARQDWVAAQKLSDSLRELGSSGNENTADRILAASLAGEKKYDESVKLLEANLASSKNDSTAVAALVQGYLRAGQPAKAEELLKSVLSSDPNNVQARVLLGSLYLSMQKPDDAEVAFKTAIEKAPDKSIGYSALGEFYMRGKHFDVAEKTLREGLTHQPTDNVLHLLLAMTLEVSGQYDGAITEYEAMLANDPRSTIAANNLASLLSDHRADPASLDRAFSIASRFADSNVPQFLDTLGWINFLRGKYDQALPLLKSAVDKLPSDGNQQIPNAGVMQFHLAMTYKELGQIDRAKAGLEKAIELLPHDGSEFTKAQAALGQLASTNNAPTNNTDMN